MIPTLPKINLPTFKGYKAQVLEYEEGPTKRSEVEQDIVEINKITDLIKDPAKVKVVASSKMFQNATLEVQNNNDTTTLDINTSKGGFICWVLDKFNTGYKFFIGQKELENNADSYQKPLIGFRDALKRVCDESPDKE